MPNTENEPKSTAELAEAVVKAALGKKHDRATCGLCLHEIPVPRAAGGMRLGYPGSDKAQPVLG